MCVRLVYMNTISLTRKLSYLVAFIQQNSFSLRVRVKNHRRTNKPGAYVWDNMFNQTLTLDCCNGL